MRGGMTVLLVFLVCVVAVVLYIFLGRMQVVNKIKDLREQDEVLQAELGDLRRMENEIPQLMERLPTWSRQLAMFGEAIPPQINDHTFFANLADEARVRDVRILRIETTKGESWLGEITEDMQADMEALGINVSAARSVKVAFYTATVVGDFEDVLTVFENLKKHNRLYTIDMVAGPATAFGGESGEQIDPEQTPLTFAGSLYYGISEEAMSQDALARVFNEAISGPSARAIFNGVRGTADNLAEGAANDGKADDSPDQAFDNRNADEKLVAALNGAQGS